MRRGAIIVQAKDRSGQVRTILSTGQDNKNTILSIGTETRPWHTLSLLNGATVCRMWRHRRNLCIGRGDRSQKGRVED